jgi:hypothetical protein
VNSWLIHSGSSNSGGAPWLMYSAGMAPSAGVHARCPRLDGASSRTNASNAAPATSGCSSEPMTTILPEAAST